MKLTHLNTPRQKILLSTGLTLVLSLSLGIFIIWPSYQDIKHLSQEIFDQRLELEKLYQRGQVLKETISEYDQVQPKAASLQQIYLTRGAELNFITALEHTADSLGVQQTITLGTQNPGTDSNKLPLQLEATAKLPQLISYLAGLEALDYYVNVSTLQLSTASHDQNAGKDATPGSIGALLIANAFYQP